MRRDVVTLAANSVIANKFAVCEPKGMDAPSSTSIADLKASELQARFNLSKGYASDLVNRKRRPSLELAVQIQEAFGVPPAAWFQVDDPSSDAEAA